MGEAETPEVGGTIAGKYELDGVLGRGGMGVVFSARHLLTGRRVAVKWMLPDAAAEDGAMERFFREARAMGRIDHPSVVGVLDVGADGGAAYLVMEMLRGESLRACLAREGALPVSRAVQLLLPAMEGIEAAHRAGVVHRDLKPENLFLVAGPGGTTSTKVLDFGISKLQSDGPMGRSSGGALTRSGAIMGTPQYMAPEQVRGARDIDGRTDQWALATILYEAIAGRAPFVADNFGALLVSIATESFAPLDRLVPDVPGALADAIHRALEKDPTHRFPDVASFARAIERFAGDGARFVDPRPSSIAPPPEPPLALAPTATPRSSAARVTPALEERRSSTPTRPARPVPLERATDAELAIELDSGARRPAARAPGRQEQSAEPEAPLPRASWLGPRALAALLVVASLALLGAIALHQLSRGGGDVEAPQAASPPTPTPTPPEPTAQREAEPEPEPTDTAPTIETPLAPQATEAETRATRPDAGTSRAHARTAHPHAGRAQPTPEPAATTPERTTPPPQGRTGTLSREEF